MTIALEHIQPEDWAAVNRVVDALRSLVLDTGGVSLGIRIGSGTCTWTANNNSPVVTVVHGLGRPPSKVFLQEVDISTRYIPSSIGATSFGVSGYTTNAANITATRTFYWVAIG